MTLGSLNIQTPAPKSPSLAFNEAVDQLKSLRREIFYASEQGNVRDLNKALDSWATPSLRSYRIKFKDKLGLTATLNAVDGSNPAFVGASNGHLPVIKALQAFDPALVKASDVMGRTIVHAAAAGGHDGLIKPLHEMGLDLNAQDKNKRTPAHDAALMGHLGVILALNENDADIGKADRFQMTPEMYAAKHNNMKMAYVIGGITRNDHALSEQVVIAKAAYLP